MVKDEITENIRKCFELNNDKSPAIKLYEI